MNVSEMMGQLALRLEDADKVKFTDAIKLDTLDNAQTRLANLMHPAYLTELQTLESSFTITAGVSAELTSTNLTGSYSILGGSEGVLQVRDSATGTVCTRLELSDVKKNENSYLAGSVANPLYYIFDNKIYVFPTSGIAAVDIYYLRVPVNLVYKFAASGGSGTTVTTNDTYIAINDVTLSKVADAYNGAVLYNHTQTTYFVVEDFAYSNPTYTFTINDSAVTTAASDDISIVTHGFDTANVAAVTCELNTALHELVVSLAEAECWAMDAKKERIASAQERAYNEIAVLNSKYEEATGIGTAGDKRYAK